MDPDIEIWFEEPPDTHDLAEAMERFGELRRRGVGRLVLVEGDADSDDGGIQIGLEERPPPPTVKRAAPSVSAVLWVSAMLTGSRGFWLARVASVVQRRFGGTVHLPASGEVYVHADAFEASWPDH